MLDKRIEPVIRAWGAVAAIGIALAAVPVPCSAQFQLPSQPQPGVGPSRQHARELAQELDFQYTWGSDTEYFYDRNLDLDNARKGNAQIVAPTVFFLGTRRPLNWLDISLGATFEQQLKIKELGSWRLPDNSIERSPRRGFTARVDVANVMIKNIPDHPMEFTFGRRTFEDPRLFLYDTTLDGVHVKYRGENYNTEVSVTRADHWDLTLFEDLPPDSVKNYILYHEYRGIEDNRIAAYAIARLDRDPRSEGRFKLFGLRAWGRPSDELNYWAEYGVVRGVDEANRPQPLHGTGYDLGGVYRYSDLPFAPCLIVGWAYGSGDGNSRDGVNREYRQTGLQSNEGKFCGPAQYKRYGEFTDPELSNLRIRSIGFGVRPSANVHIDVLLHQYTQHYLATDFRNGQPTAQMNRITARRSVAVGKEVDVVIALRRLFDTKWTFDLRVGYFLPGAAYLRRDGPNQQNPQPHDPDRGLRVLAVLSY